MVRRILIIGAGGIGSYLVSILNKTNMYNITVADPDKVERKNLTYQNFREKDLLKNKATLMEQRFKSVVKSIPFPILTASQIIKYDLVICCADNLDVRRLLYRTDCKWLDLRSQGRNAAYISYQVDKALADTVLIGPEGSFSCQGDNWDGKSKNLHYMHIAIAGMGAEWVQRWFNDEEVEAFKVVNV